jgi:predicted nucleic acid-binding protein
VDASPVILLGKIGTLDLLMTCPSALRVPQAVADELDSGEGDPAQAWIREDGRQFVEHTEVVASEIEAWDLGRGERHVLAFSFQHDGWTAVVDDGAARRCAKALDIPVLGTLGVLIVAKRDGRIEHVRPWIEALMQAGLHVDEAVVEHALRLAGEEA